MLIRLGLLTLSSLLLTFAYAPYSQFYLAWIGMVPWLLALRTLRNCWAAFGWGFIGGFIFNLISLTWLFHATLLGTIALVGYISLFWGLAAAMLHGTSALTPNELKKSDVPFLKPNELKKSDVPFFKGASLKGTSLFFPPPLIATLLIATVWSGCEWFRGWLFNGFQWMFLGQTQSPIVVMCQVADIGGVFAVTFWVMCVNALIARVVIGFSPSPRARGKGGGEGAFAPAKAGLAADAATRVRADPSPSLSPSSGRGVRVAALTVLGIIALVVTYGSFRIAQTSTTPGPRVMVLQSNFPHARGGARTVSWDDQTDYHLRETNKALASETQAVDLVVWSETVLPPMNPQGRAKSKNPRWRDGIHNDLLALVRTYQTSVICGAYALLSFEGAEEDADIRNSTYLYSAFLDDQPRYDKIHLVPYGESVPFKRSIPWLHKLMFQMAAYSVNYLITAGAFDDLRVFDLPTRESKVQWRFVTPICFEDIDGRLVSRMFRPPQDRPGEKRADVIINISNDGWFKGNMRRQHFQNAIFRSIENRAPTARADNTGISGYIDSTGRVDWDTLMTEDTSGVRTKQLQIDARLTLYTRFGDAFGAGCFVVAIAMRFAQRLWHGRPAHARAA